MLNSLHTDNITGMAGQATATLTQRPGVEITDDN